MPQEFVWTRKREDDVPGTIEDSIDPVLSHKETDTHHVIDNGHSVYLVPKSEIIGEWKIREMLPIEKEKP